MIHKNIFNSASPLAIDALNKTLVDLQFQLNSTLQQMFDLKNQILLKDSSLLALNKTLETCNNDTQNHITQLNGTIRFFLY